METTTLHGEEEDEFVAFMKGLLPNMGPNAQKPRTSASDDDDCEFFFDDEPLERILYGEGHLPGPTSANIFLTPVLYARRMARAHSEGRTDEVVWLASRLAEIGCPITPGVCHTLVDVLRIIVPDRPIPIVEQDLSGLGPLLREIWEAAVDRDDRELMLKAYVPIFRWYEIYERYDDARSVLESVREVVRQRGAGSVDEGILVNNLGFEYMMEGRYRDAIPLFDEAAAIFAEKRNRVQHANSRANLWTCRFATGDFGDPSETEAEVARMEEVLVESCGWHARKPLLLMARMEERRGNMAAAIELVKRAIDRAEGSSTRFPEIDRKYLKHLESLS